ncbi:hypothetical protein U1Q18_029331 [Sarracenia purpurea var. burkii]
MEQVSNLIPNPFSSNEFNNMAAMSMLACILISWTLIHRWRQRNTTGPKTWPLIGAAIEHLVNYDRMHDWLVNYLRESKTMVVKMPFMTYTYIADPANVEYVLKTNFANYPKGKVYHSYMEVLLGDGIFNVDGELWRKQRKTASFEFASKNLRDFSTVVFREYSLKLSSILNQAFLHKQEVDMQELFMRMTLDSICKVGFGVEIGTLAPHLPDNHFAKAFDSANITVTLRFIDPLWKIKKFLNVGSEAVLDQTIKIIDDFTYSVIRKRKAEIEAAGETCKNEKKGNDQVKHDILSRFIELGKDPENNINDKSLRDVVINFVIAGRDTTATTLSWAIYMIMTHGHVAEKLYSELKTFEEEQAKEENVSLIQYDTEDPESFNQRATQFAGLLRYDSLGRLSYLHGVITETLRLYPAVPQTRNLGVTFNYSLAGPRICLGKDSAYLQLKMALAIMCRFFKFNLVPGHPVKYRMMTILSMAHGLKVTIDKRF